MNYINPTWLGDSITEKNDLAMIHYHEILARKWHSKNSYNLGVSGSTISSARDSMVKRYIEIPDSTDFICVYGGINDFGQNVLLGSRDDDTYETFYGALNVLFTGLKTRFPNTDMLFVSHGHIGDSFISSDSSHRYSSNQNNLNYNQAEYEGIIAEKTREFGIPHLSLYEEPEMDFSNSKQASLYSVDTLHPNDSGHEVIASKIDDFLNEN
ncbi:SGNH/GDSL hydrolase family protein [Weissella minor]|uniref:SGNH hydrolase-type esterase domain-containing protein n=1 Tax=Weissella minor TaxID=1620 RepID=A0A0R2JPV4_9LACO|nr:SGNH/GDSL hydrolase family protein [Weissella minor]KRN76908.1 hypothetical protein IV67_GL000418 [Weissella minor]